MSDENQVKIEKRKYVKPEVIEVRLVAGEAVLGFCKNAIGGISLCTPGDPDCSNESPRS